MKFLVLLIPIFILFSCKSGKETVIIQEVENTKPVNMLGPRAIIYKTNADYNNNVPVMLSDDKSKIISFPHPSDLKIGDGYAIPTPLNGGYLFDNRGINQNVAFLKYTYKEYSLLTKLPSIEDLYENIIDKEPLVEMYDCGIKQSFKNIEFELNALVDSNELYSKCKILVKKQ